MVSARKGRSFQSAPSDFADLKSVNDASAAFCIACGSALPFIVIFTFTPPPPVNMLLVFELENIREPRGKFTSSGPCSPTRVTPPPKEAEPRALRFVLCS